MKLVCSVIMAAAIGAIAPEPVGVVPAKAQDQRPDTATPADDRREERLTALRRRAQERIDGEATRFSAAELSEIEARYASAFRADLTDGLTFLRRPEGERVLEDLVRRYPRSNRAGCALLLLAQASTGARREQYLRDAIAFEGDAWFENGVQVAAFSRAMLAVHLAGLDRFDEAERLATELVTRFPGAIDQSGATLDETLSAIRLLRDPRLQF